MGNQVYERVPLYMRTQLWKSLLIHADAQRKTTLAERADEDDAPGCDAAFYDALQEVPAPARACRVSRNPRRTLVLMKYNGSAPSFWGTRSCGMMPRSLLSDNAGRGYQRDCRQESRPSQRDRA